LTEGKRALLPAQEARHGFSWPFAVMAGIPRSPFQRPISLVMTFDVFDPLHVRESPKALESLPRGWRDEASATYGLWRNEYIFPRWEMRFVAQSVDEYG
jgi:hypothetical protein